MKPTPAPGWLRELADARATYQELLGWPVSVQVGERHVVVQVGQVLDAVTMPAVLGACVREQLHGTATSVPTIANSTGTAWTFLVKARRAPGELPVPPIQLAPTGSYVVIPSGLGESAGSAECWIEAPVPNRPLPALADVMAFATLQAS
jgi:hypothetical protein